MDIRPSKCRYAFVQTPSMCNTERNANVNYDFGWQPCVRVGPSALTNSTTLAREADGGRGAVPEWGQEECGESTPSSQFCCEPETSLKKNMRYLICFYSFVASFYERVRKGYEWKKLQGSFSQGRGQLLPGLSPLGLGPSRTAAPQAQFLRTRRPVAPRGVTAGTSFGQRKVTLAIAIISKAGGNPLLIKKWGCEAAEELGRTSHWRVNHVRSCDQRQVSKSTSVQTPAGYCRFKLIWFVNEIKLVANKRQ